MSDTTIVLADDHPIVREGLRGLLETEPGFRVIGEATDGLEAVSLVERLKPDVLIIDVVMPGLTGLEATRQISRRSPQTRVIILSMHANEIYVLRALRNGASGYVLKESSTADLVQAVREVVAGRHYPRPPLSERAIEAYLQQAEAAVQTPYEKLTTREREMLHLIVEGHSNAEIAERLSISPRTVATHRTNMMRKLGLRTQADLIRYALKQSIVPLED